MTHFRRVVTAGALTTAALTSMVRSTPASATGTFTVHGGYDCVTNGPQKFWCDFDWTSTSGPFSATTQLSNPNYAHFLQIVYSGSTATVYGSCTKTRSFTLKLTVTDSTGATGSGTDNAFDCV